MAAIEDFKDFLNKSYDKKTVYEVTRSLELSKAVESNYLNRYAIQITFNVSSVPELILEHKVYNTFAKTRNRFTYHPEDTDIPVKAHYHIYPPNGKKELYAVNIDGTAHHKKNRGVTISKKEADELRSMGVAIPANNIIECLVTDDAVRIINEGFQNESFYSIFLMIE